MDTQSVITRTITVAEGRYAPGHLGELTQHIPFEMVDEALAATRTTQSRLRDLPSRVVVYLLLAACLFPEIGYTGVWRKLTAGLQGLPIATPTSSALSQARRRISVAPLRWLFDLLRLRVRVMDAEITIATTTGRHTGLYRLVTTLTDHRHYPGGELVTLYHRRWEIETTYLELKSSILGGRVLRARTPTGIEQEIYALLVVYQLLRTAMADATSTKPEIDPDRASFSIAYQAARDQLVQAAGIIAGTIIDLIGTIGRHVLANLMHARRLRVCPRIVKRAISKYQARGPTIDRTSYKATISVDILTPTDP